MGTSPGEAEIKLQIRWLPPVLPYFLAGTRHPDLITRAGGKEIISMELEHIAVAANSEEQSDRFFVGLLGLNKTRSFSVPADMMRGLFGIARDTRVVRYGSEGLDAEVFITGDDGGSLDAFTHSCLVVKDREELCQRAKAMGLSVSRVAKPGGDGTVTFIRDFYGNRYEIK